MIKKEPVVKITWFAAVLTFGFINGHNGYKRWFPWRHQNLENNPSQVQHSEDSPVPTDVLLLAIWTSVLFPFDFSFYISVPLVINFFKQFFL